MSFLRIISIAIFWTITVPLLAIDTLKIGEGFEHLSIQEFGWVHLVKKQELDFNRIKNLPDSVFEPLKKIGIVFLPEKQVHWLKFYLKNTTEKPLELMYEVQIPVINRVQFFAIKSTGEEISYKLSGDDFPFKERAIFHRNFLFPIELHPDETQEFYVFADNYAEGLGLRMKLFDQETFHKRDQVESFLLTLFFGFLGCICVLVVILTGMIRSRILVYFSIYCLAVSTTLFAWIGNGFQYIWGAFPYFNDFSNYFFTFFATISLLAITRTYLNTKENFVLIDKAIALIQYILVFGLFYLFFYRQFTESIAAFMQSLGVAVQLTYSILIILASILSYKKTGNRNHLLFLSGFLFILSTNAFRLLAHFKLIYAPIRLEYPIFMGFLFDLLILMFIIGSQIRNTFLQNLKLSSQITELKLEAASALIEGQQQERQRLSLDLHDGTSLKLATLKMRLSQILPKLTSEKQKTEVKNLLQEIGKISEQVRNFTHALSPLDMEEQTFLEAVEDLVYSIEQADYNLDVECDFDDFDEEKLTNIQAHVLFQTFQELLNNILKHAKAKKVYIALKVIDNQIVMEVFDDGRGFDVEVKKKGIGLKNIQLRATFLNGKFKMQSNETGSKFEFSFPV